MNKFKKGLTPEEAAVCALGLWGGDYRYLRPEEIDTTVRESTFDERDSLPDIIEQLEAVALLDVRGDKLGYAELAMGLEVHLTYRGYHNERYGAANTKFTIPSVANWFFANGEPEMARRVSPGFAPTIKLAEVSAAEIEKASDLEAEVRDLKAKNLEARQEPEALTNKVHLHPCQNSENEHYPSDLSIALELWTALHIEGTGSEHRSYTQNANAWLNENHPDLTDTTKGRIRAVANPTKNKNDGKPK